MTCKSRSPARPFMRANHNAPSSVVPSPAMVVLLLIINMISICAASAGVQYAAPSASSSPHGAHGPSDGKQRDQCPRWTILPPPRRWPSTPNRHFHKRLDRNDLATLLSVGIVFSCRPFRVAWGAVAPGDRSPPRELGVQQLSPIAGPDSHYPTITDSLLATPS